MDIDHLDGNGERRKGRDAGWGGGQGVGAGGSSRQAIANTSIRKQTKDAQPDCRTVGVMVGHRQDRWENVHQWTRAGTLKQVHEEENSEGGSEVNSVVFHKAWP